MTENELLEIAVKAQEVKIELTKWELINSCETVEQLQKSIEFIYEGEENIGRSKNLNKSRMIERIDQYIKNGPSVISPNTITREYGIRQQAMYLHYYLNL